MNTAFSFRRVWDYLKWGAVFNKKRYLYIFLMIPAVYLFNLCFHIWSDRIGANQDTILLPILMVMFPIALEPMLNEKENDSKLVFTLPASSLERFASMWLKCVLLFPLFALFAYYLLNQLSGLLFSLQIPTFSTPLELLQSIGYKTIYIWFALQSIVLAATLSFKQTEKWKSSLLLVATVLFAMSFSEFLINSKNGIFIDTNSGSNRVVGFGLVWPEWFITTIKYYALFLFPFGMWMVSFFKIREKEI